MHYADYKTILSPSGGFNLYRGCTHGCVYCDARSVCYRMKHDFEDIEVKRNAPEILEAQLRGRRKPCMLSTGAMCDPYIPLEEELRLTRRCLEIIARYGFGLCVQTKSARILRDLDLLQRINANAKCVAATTLTTFDEALCAKIEPDVSSTRERFRALEALRGAGIPTVVWLSPILPFINDTEENLRGLLDYCFQVRVKAILCFGFGVTLREGNREYFYAALDRRFPGMKRRYARAFGNRYVCDSPNSAALWKILKEECESRGVLYGTDAVFAYVREFPEKHGQISIFGGEGNGFYSQRT